MYNEQLDKVIEIVKLADTTLPKPWEFKNKTKAPKMVKKNGKWVTK